MNAREISELLRRRIMADIHLGRLKPGDRLPSLRTVGNELGVSIRAAARAYMELQEEGLVTVRGRSGIYLVLPQVADVSLDPPLDWYAEMLKDAWARRITVSQLAETLEQIVATPIRAACVESTADHMEAFCGELADDFALDTTSVMITSEGVTVDGRPMSLVDALADVDFAVTTAFHAGDVQAAASVLNKPVVIVSMNDSMVESIERELKAQPVTIVADDPAFLHRFRETVAERVNANGDLQLMTVDEMLKDDSALEGRTPLLTRAARKRLNEEACHLVSTPMAFMSVHATRKLVQCMMAAYKKRALQPA
jgi:DNA-binding transcriptional regulator YhcF (GntR family)